MFPAFGRILFSISVTVHGRTLCGFTPFHQPAHADHEQLGGALSLGACGFVNQDSDFVAAISTNIFANGANCGRSFLVTDVTTGLATQGIVADECIFCGIMTFTMDMTPGLFEFFAPLDDGSIDIQWQLCD
ncbi:RlpA-like double-psi beta-barrel-protein domain-containing protein-containing protein [Mycena epipterygia]|nr:RlpA-like double-psi beta-barrel-protein domain-containing protein-containing protein [Mycena epipterygia]